MKYPKFKVVVRCFTFNQSRYIEETMNGFTMQQTNFPYVCCIVDDASTDGEQQVIIEYIKEYFDIEVRFNIMLADVNKIISESVKDLL